MASFSDYNVRSNDKGNARMGHSTETLREFEVFFLLVCGLVHGIRNWADIHVLVLAFAGKINVNYCIPPGNFLLKPFSLPFH